MQAGRGAAAAFSGFALLNPEVLARACDTRGASNLQGMMTLQAEATDSRADPPGGMAPGQGLAMTPGKVVARRPLAELIQDRPTTDTVHPEPIPIGPTMDHGIPHRGPRVP
ncbi:MAG: hypothetical protein ACXIUV_02140 [Alkalilacustris sp.]